MPLPVRPEPIEIGRGELLREGETVALLGYGYGVSVALGAAERLAEEHGLDATVADARFAKPLDAELVERLAAEHDLLVTVEENVLAGGFGSGVLEHLADRDLLGGHARDALRPPRPLRDPRQARAAARGGRPHARGRGRAGGAGSARALAGLARAARRPTSA